MVDLDKMEGLLDLQKEKCHGGFKAVLDRKEAFLNPELVSPFNYGLLLVAVDKESDRFNVEKIDGAIPKRIDIISKRLQNLGRRGIKSLVTKGIRWSISTAFGNEKDMETTTFSGAFSFADPTSITYDSFVEGEKEIVSFEDFEMNLTRFEGEDSHGLRNGTIVFSALGGTKSFSKAVLSELKETKYDSTEGLFAYAKLGSLANYAWARRQILKGIIEMASNDAFGKQVKVKKLLDTSLNMVYDDGKKLTVTRGFQNDGTVKACPEDNGFVLSDENGAFGRLVKIDG